MYSSIQKNSLAQFGIGLQLGLAVWPLMVSLKEGTRQNRVPHPSSIANNSRITLLGLRSLVYRNSLGKFPTIFSTFTDECLRRFSNHLEMNCMGFRGIKWLPAFDAQRIRATCAKLQPVVQDVALVALLAFNFSGHKMAHRGSFIAMACQFISPRFGYSAQVNQIVGVASQCMFVVANPIPALILLAIPMCVSEIEHRSVAEIKHLANQVFRTTLGLFHQPRRSLSQICSFVDASVRNFINQAEYSSI